MSQASKNKILTISLAGLLVISTLLFIYQGKRDRVTVNEDYFNPGRVDLVDKVELESSKGNVSLSLTNNRWKVNSAYEADANMIKVLFATLGEMKVRRPLAQAVSDSIGSYVQHNGVKVRLWSAGNRVAEFVAGGNSQKTEAWFVKSGESQPFIMVIPGYRVYVSGIFELDESGWRNKRIFDFNWSNFKSLKATYYAEPNQGFEVEKQGRHFGIKGLKTDTSRLNTYLDDVSLLFALEFLAVKDTLHVPKPVALIEVTDFGDRKYKLELFKSSAFGGPEEEGGRLGSGDFVLLSRREIMKVAKRKDYFRAR